MPGRNTNEEEADKDEEEVLQRIGKENRFGCKERVCVIDRERFVIASPEFAQRGREREREKKKQKKCDLNEREFWSSKRTWTRKGTFKRAERKVQFR